jgi:hypothetical protein
VGPACVKSRAEAMILRMNRRAAAGHIFRHLYANRDSLHDPGEIAGRIIGGRCEKTEPDASAKLAADPLKLRSKPALEVIGKRAPRRDEVGRRSQQPGCKRAIGGEIDGRHHGGRGWQVLADVRGHVQGLKQHSIDGARQARVPKGLSSSSSASPMPAPIRR